MALEGVNGHYTPDAGVVKDGGGAGSPRAVPERTKTLQRDHRGISTLGGPLCPARLQAVTPLRDIEVHESLDSTSSRARRLIAEGSPRRPFLVVAQEQTAGRGRDGRTWATLRGSLAMTVGLRAGQDLIAPERIGLVSLAAALAVHETVVTWLKQTPVTAAASGAMIRWPNDVLVEGRKIAGVLIEAIGGGDLLVGIGLNTNGCLADAPAEIRQIACSLADIGQSEVDHAAIIVAIVRSMLSHFDAIGAGSRSVIGLANERCFHKGQIVSFQRSATQRIRGHCTGIGPNGGLLLDVDGRLAEYCTGRALH